MSEKPSAGKPVQNLPETVVPEKIELEKICKDASEVLCSKAFNRVANLFCQSRKKKGTGKIADILTFMNERDENGEPLFAGLHEYWQNRLQPRLQQRELSNGEHARINRFVTEIFLSLVKKLGDKVEYSAGRLPTFEAIARDLLNSGYVPLIFSENANPFGEPVYPNQENTLPPAGSIRVIALPVMEDRPKNTINNPIIADPRVELSNFIKPTDPDKIRKMAERDELGFSHEAGICSHMSVAVCRPGKNQESGGNKEPGDWSEPVTIPNARFASHPLEQIRQYGSGLFEGIGVERGEEGKINIFRLRDHWKRMSLGGQYFRMPPIPFPVFEKMVIQTVQANADYVPPAGKGRLYIRPNWFDCGPKMHVGNSGNYMLLMTAIPIGSAQSYYKKKPVEQKKGSVEDRQDEGITLFFPHNAFRAVENGAGQTKADGNYGATIPHIEAAAKNGMQGVMYMNESRTRLEESNASSLIFLQLLPGKKTASGKQKYRLITPSLEHGTILDSVTRKTILELAGTELDWEVVERDIEPIELPDLAEQGSLGGIVAMFSAGTGAVLTPIHHIQHGWLCMKTEDSGNSGPIRTFDVDRSNGRITGKKISIGRYDAENPYGEAGRDLLQLLLDAKSGRLQARKPDNKTYQSWLTEIKPLTSK